MMMSASTTAGWAALLLLLLLQSLCSPSSSAPVGFDHPASCCFHYTARPLPLGHIKEYYETNSKCSQPAVVFITKKDRPICANPAEPWVQDRVKHLEERN